MKRLSIVLIAQCTGSMMLNLIHTIRITLHYSHFHNVLHYIYFTHVLFNVYFAHALYNARFTQRFILYIVYKIHILFTLDTALYSILILQKG